MGTRPTRDSRCARDPAFRQALGRKSCRGERDCFRPRLPLKVSVGVERAAASNPVSAIGLHRLEARG